MNVVPLMAWTLARDDDDRRKEKKKKNDDPGSRRRLFENEARLACSPFVFFWGGGILRARALYSSTLGRTERIFGETFLCGKTNVIIKAVEKHFEKYNEEYYYDYAED